jgi:hypothetical protein
MSTPRDLAARLDELAKRVAAVAERAESANYVTRAHTVNVTYEYDPSGPPRFADGVLTLPFSRYPGRVNGAPLEVITDGAEFDRRILEGLSPADLAAYREHHRDPDAGRRRPPRPGERPRITTVVICCDRMPRQRDDGSEGDQS